MLPQVRGITEVTDAPAAIEGDWAANLIDQSRVYARQLATVATGMPPADPGCQRKEPSSVATQKFRTPVLLKWIGAALATN